MTDYPMPALPCPAWCTSDHAAEWDQFVRVTFWDTPIPAADGSYLPKRERTEVELAEWLRTWAPEVLHTCAQGEVRLGTSSEGATVELQQGFHGIPEAYIAVEGPLDASAARRLAAVLLDTADVLESITGNEPVDEPLAQLLSDGTAEQDADQRAAWLVERMVTLSTDTEGADDDAAREAIRRARAFADAITNACNRHPASIEPS